MSEPTALIVGASRGLGLALAAEYARRGWNVIGTVRGDQRTGLHEQAAKSAGRITVESLDMTAPQQLSALRDRPAGRTLELPVRELPGRGRSLVVGWSH